MSTPLLLQAFAGTNRRVPVWFMRQAGRYLPEYQALKVKYSLDEMFLQSELAAEITCQPLDVLGVDAAILFADILTLPRAMGMDITFSRESGPLISNPLRAPADVDRLHDFDDLEHVAQTIRLIRKRLSPSLALIGFAGSPFTVLTYLVEGGSSVSFLKTLELMMSEPRVFERCLEILTRNTIRYIQLQQDAGIQVFQLFDSWAGILSSRDYDRWVLPYVQEIFKQVSVPSIYYLRNTAHLLALAELCGANILSVCHTVDFQKQQLFNNKELGLQGNLFSHTLFASPDVLAKDVDDILQGARQNARFIFNLSHGVFPRTRVDVLQSVVRQVHAFPWGTS